MAFAYNPERCSLTAEERKDLEKRLSATEPYEMVPVSETEMKFLRETHDCVPFPEGDLRDEFAKAALQGMLANGEIMHALIAMARDTRTVRPSLPMICWPRIVGEQSMQ